MIRFAMKHFVAVGALVSMCIVGGVVVVRYRSCQLTSPTKSYATLEQAEEMMSMGWLPDFLPVSARDIRLKIHYSNNQVLAAFSFDPSDDTTPMLRTARELPKGSLSTVHPTAISGGDALFPEAIIKGKFDEIMPEGFRIYDIARSRPDETTDGKVIRWYVLVNQQAGIGYVWTGFDR
jgi:hypothetical protein